MKHPAVVVVVLLFTAVGGARLLAQTDRNGSLEPGSPAMEGGSGSIAGRVTDPSTNGPVRGAEIVAVSGRGGRATAITDETGRYRLVGLGAGEWRLTVSKGGYTTWQYGQRRPFQLPPPVALARGQQLTADIPLTRGGAISGHVVDEFGEPLAAAQVRAYRARMERGARRLQAVAAADLSDDNGSFRVYGLPPGDYYVAASLRVAPLDSVVETTYAPTYFPGTGNLAEAQRIRLGLGAEATVNVPLLPVRRLRVSGTVSNAAGAPADAYLSLESDSSEFGVPLGFGGVTRADGSFTVSDVPPGRYRLTASLRGDEPNESGWVPVTVYDDDVEGATIVTSRPSRLRGTFVADAGVSRPLPMDLEVMAVAARPVGTVLGSGTGSAFEIGEINEAFRLVVSEPDGWSVKEVVVNGSNATDVPVSLSPGQEGQARIVLTDRITEVGGAVTPAAADRSVIVFPEDTTRWGYRSRYVRLAQTDAKGRYRIAGLPPGSRYLAVATDYLEDGEHLDPEFLSGIQAQSVPFALDEAEKRTVDLRIVER